MLLWGIISIMLLTIWFMKDRQSLKKDLGGNCIGIIIGSFCIATIIGSLLSAKYTNITYDIISHQDIYSANLGSEVHGDFFIGTGTISSQSYYYYYASLNNGNKILSKVPTNITQINLTDTLKPQIITTQEIYHMKNKFVITLTKPFNKTFESFINNNGDEAGKSYELIVPSKAITQKIDLNLK